MFTFMYSCTYVYTHTTAALLAGLARTQSDARVSRRGLCLREGVSLPVALCQCIACQACVTTGQDSGAVAEDKMHSVNEGVVAKEWFAAR